MLSRRKVSSMNVVKQMMYDVYLMGKLENLNWDATLDISKPWTSRSLVEVPQSSRYWYFTVIAKICKSVSLYFLPLLHHLFQFDLTFEKSSLIHLFLSLILCMGDQCLWILWITFILKFTSSEMYNKVGNESSYIVIPKSSYPNNYIPTNQLISMNIDPTNKNDFTVHTAIVYLQFMTSSATKCSTFLKWDWGRVSFFYLMLTVPALTEIHIQYF